MKRNKENLDFINIEYKRDIKTILMCGSLFVLLGIIFVILSEIVSKSIEYALQVSGASLIACGIVISVAGLLYIKGKTIKLREHIETFSFSTENTTRAAVLGYPDPIVVVSVNGVIKWYNPAFAELCKRNSLFGEKIQEIFPAIRLSAFLKSNKIHQDFSYDGRDFVIKGELSTVANRGSDVSLIGLSFSDVSEIAKLNKRLDEQRCVVCMAVIDNYDEVIKETPNSSHGALMGDIERCVGDWVDKGNGFFRRYERDRFLILFKASDFEVLKEEKFAILDEVKEINQQNKIPVTLSIGVGAMEDDLRESERIAGIALDMALGRGGDQAVMKTDDGYVFFGAKSLGVEKTTKVKARVVGKGLSGIIDSSSKIIIMGHKNADFDSFGAAVGLFRAVMDRNKAVYIAMDRANNNVKEILPDILMQPEYAEGIISHERALALTDKNTFVIIVDTHRPSMTEYPDIIAKAGKIALIDHHRRSEEFIENTDLIYHEPYASSTCEMVAEILQYMNEEQILSVQEAEALYCGIYMDTKGFSFKTGARTFEAAAYLRKMGVDPVGVLKLFRNDLDMYIQKSKIISGAKVYRNNIAIAICEEPSKNAQIVVAQAADELLNINNIEASFVLANIGGKIIISGRSLGAINVQLILEKLGGGGHITIAGAQLENSTLNIAELKLHNAIDEVVFD